MTNPNIHDDVFISLRVFEGKKTNDAASKFKPAIMRWKMLFEIHLSLYYIIVVNALCQKSSPRTSRLVWISIHFLLPLWPSHSYSLLSLVSQLGKLNSKAEGKLPGKVVGVLEPDQLCLSFQISVLGQYSKSTICLPLSHAIYPTTDRQ
jgi:hypothetical protein